MTESEFKEFEKEFDKQNCYDLSCEARDCCECEIFLAAYEDSKNEKD